MSTIKVDNIRIASESVSRPVTGVAAASAGIQSTGIFNPASSINVSGLTDISTGIRTINFTNDFSSSTYLASGSIRTASLPAAIIQNNDFTTSSVGVQLTTGGSSTLVDRACSVILFGGLT